MAQATSQKRQNIPSDRACMGTARCAGRVRQAKRVWNAEELKNRERERTVELGGISTPWQDDPGGSPVMWKGCRDRILIRLFVCFLKNDRVAFITAQTDAERRH